MLHARVLAHQRGMRVEIGLGAEHDFMQRLALVARAQAYRFTLAHFDMARGKAHVVGHAQRGGAGHGPGVARDAPGFLLLRQGGTGVAVVRDLVIGTACAGAQGKGEGDKGLVHGRWVQAGVDAGRRAPTVRGYDGHARELYPQLPGAWNAGGRRTPIRNSGCWRTRMWNAGCWRTGMWNAGAGAPAWLTAPVAPRWCHWPVRPVLALQGGSHSGRR